MIDKYKLHKAIKSMFKEVKDVDAIVIFAYKKYSKWEIFFSSKPNKKLIPHNSVSLLYEFKKGYLSHSPSLTTDLIYEKLKK